MAGRLRKVSNEPAHAGAYSISGSLDGVRPGRRVVKELQARRLSQHSAEGLRPLTAFEDLHTLELDHVTGIDLTPLADLELRRLDLSYADGVDLTPLSSLTTLVDLDLVHLRGCLVPDHLALPASLRGLVINNDGPQETGAAVKELIEAIQWRQLSGLHSLSLGVGGLDPLEPIEVDLSLLCELPELRYLDVRPGVWHRGKAPSPLEPPFDGLARTLVLVRIDGWEPEATRVPLRQYLPGQTVVVGQRSRPNPASASWRLDPPSEDGTNWMTYGSLWEAAGGRDGETETDALRAAKRRLKASDPALLKRLDFDDESSGTGITAPTREDLEKTFRILGIASRSERQPAFRWR